MSSEDRVISMGDGLAAIPERLLLAHARGEVLFICGAGISRPAGLPDFRQLVLDVYATLDTSTHTVLTGLPPGACNQWQANCAGLTDRQTAEVKRFIVGDSYDNALAETIIGLFKAEVIHRRRPWRSLEAVEFATLEWVDWFNHRRLLEPIGNIPPAEAEERYYATLETPAMAA
jgi:hypothetical protein